MINYKHLRYFWAVAKQGGISQASQYLHITPQTISSQIQLLEQQFGQALFRKSGRKLELTDSGRQALSYADEIFSLGDELESTLRSVSSNRAPLLRVGVVDAVPKSIAYRLLEPALSLPESIRLICKESNLESLLAELAIHRLDLIIADAPIPTGLGVRGFNHSLGTCGVSFLASPSIAENLQGQFPHCLSGAPLLMPRAVSSIQSPLMECFDKKDLFPHIVGEFDDSALMKAFGQAGVGIVIVPSAIAHEVAVQYQLQVIGQVADVKEQFFAISTERHISNPAIIAIKDAARDWMK